MGDFKWHVCVPVTKPLGVFEVKDGNLGLGGRMVGGKIQG